jgi:predicted dehydrogenase
MAKKNSCRLFVDWLFTYNNEVNYIQKYYFDDKKLGEPLNINMNRLNKGPARTDTNAIQDLASHDISILEYWFRQPASSVNWISYKRNKQSLKDDSCVGILKFNKTTVQINCSWEHNIKDRTCILGFENGIVQWDDIKKEIIDEEKITLIQSSPVKNAIQAFMSDSYYEYHVIESTLSIERTLDATCFNIR